MPRNKTKVPCRALVAGSGAELVPSRLSAPSCLEGAPQLVRHALQAVGELA